VKVAYLVNIYPKTSHTFIRQEIQALEAAGVEVLRFTIRQSPLKNDAADREEFERTRSILSEGALTLLARAIGVGLSRPLRLLSALRLAIQVGRRSDRGLLLHLAYLMEACTLLGWTKEVDWLHAHFGTNPAAVAMLLRELGGPEFSFTVHGPEEFDKPEFLALGTKIHRAAFTVAVSEFGRAQLFRWADVADWNKIQVIRCGVASEFFQAPTTIPPAERRLVCVGRLSEQKGHLVLLEAVARLAERGEGFELTLVGDGPWRPQIEQFVRRRKLEGLVRLTGWMTPAQVRQEILRARCLVVPSFAEGLPVVILEALALGRPVISTAIAGIPELIEDGASGWLVPAGSIDSLARRISEALAASPLELARMGREGARRVAQQHDVKREAGKLMALFAQHAFPPRMDIAPERALAKTRSAR